MGTIIDLVNTYERLRLSGQVPEAVKARLREPKREYRLVTGPLRLRRTAFGPWQAVDLADRAPLAVAPVVDGARVGLQLRCGGLTAPGAAWRSDRAVRLEAFASLAPYLAGAGADLLATRSDNLGTTNPGVTQTVRLAEEGPGGSRCVVYTATSQRVDDGGWSVFGKRFAQPVDLSEFRGVGLWLRGDGGGGRFKLQLRDATGATDWYVTNDFTGWRYVQLARPDGPSSLPVDYRRIEHLQFYYNGLPPRQSVTMAIGEVRALPALDEAELVEPVIEVAGRRIVFPTTLRAGERLVWFPGEAPYVVPARQGPRRDLPAVPPVELPAAAELRLSAKAPVIAQAKARWVQEGSEELPLPEAALATPLPKLR
jgi:hypothetical protein